MAEKLHIASCSFGKDSIATILLALEHNEPLDRVVFAEVMFDHQRGVSGEIPEHIEWIYSTAIRFEDWIDGDKLLNLILGSILFPIGLLMLIIALPFKLIMKLYKIDK